MATTRITSAAERRAGLTLVEILLAMGLLSVVMTVVYLTFAAALRSWRTGVRLSDNLNHADAIVEPLMAGLRSAYYADTGRVEGRFGFHHQAGRLGINDADRISWVKTGGAFLGTESVMAATPHRIEISVEPQGPDAPAGLWMRVWRMEAQPKDFDPDTVPPILLSQQVEGFRCRMLDPEYDPDTSLGDLRWLDDWRDDHTNRLPQAVELTLWVRSGPTAEPLEVVRIVELPLADLSWNPRRAARRDEPGATRAPRTRGSSADPQRPVPLTSPRPAATPPGTEPPPRRTPRAAP